MATGILGQAAPAATTNTVVYTVPASTVTVATISIVNTTVSPIVVRLALASSGTPTTSEYIEYDTIIAGNGVLERSGIVMNATEAVVVFSSAVGLAVSVYGYEEV
jgi:hypothetical protein